jgi:hypothetical protein
MRKSYSSEFKLKAVSVVLDEEPSIYGHPRKLIRGARVVT